MNENLCSCLIYTLSICLSVCLSVGLFMALSSWLAGFVCSLSLYFCLYLSPGLSAPSPLPPPPPLSLSLSFSPSLRPPPLSYSLMSGQCTLKTQESITIPKTAGERVPGGVLHPEEQHDGAGAADGPAGLPRHDLLPPPSTTSATASPCPASPWPCGFPWSP